MVENSIHLSQQILYKRSHKTFAKGYHFPIHAHRLSELYLILEGSCQMDLANKTYQFQAGDCVILAPFVIHSLTIPKEDTCTVIQLHFDLYHFPHFLVGQDRQNPFEMIDLFKDTNSHLLFQPTEEEAAYLLQSGRLPLPPDLYESSLQQLEFTVFLTKILYRIKREPEGRPELGSRYVQNTLEYIHHHFSNQLLLATIAKELNITPHYLNKLFKAETGTTIKHYLTLYRLNRSVELMSRTKKSLTFIAQEVGFNDVQHYSKTFRKYFNTSPRQFRQLMTPDSH
ncbi:TPA: helix-turn-helix domain-containing protein [Streptococcus suis]|uniref:AraC family transcriptional regulator n=1 Tax=Streptococcus suivaginalis TaxID=3028082 RepID=A0AA96VSD1_9STRE|nr:AraC family transcriptional regulator [Streptococcus sp. 29896]MCK4028319.1 AraC family transcriptional regulator [Streptococcus suis]WNY47340.1 AraC family transcriptional regulator [Streptococcus sp. 29896]HEL1585650.1 helix-turn-helix domain-containing protein [Streptococcus suis]